MRVDTILRSQAVARKFDLLLAFFGRGYRGRFEIEAIH
jgi:hypothetical protein